MALRFSWALYIDPVCHTLPKTETGIVTSPTSKPANGAKSIDSRQHERKRESQLGESHR